MTWKCPKCNSDNDDSTLRCVNCQFEIDEQALDATIAQTTLSHINAATVGTDGFDAARCAAELYTRTNSIKEVVAALKDKGLTEEQATEVAHRVYSAKAGLQPGGKQNPMMSGVLMLVLGIAIGVVSFVAAPVFGVQIFAFGLMAAGGLQIGRGMFNR
jgi:hypothetical protein